MYLRYVRRCRRLFLLIMSVEVTRRAAEMREIDGGDELKYVGGAADLSSGCIQSMLEI